MRFAQDSPTIIFQLSVSYIHVPSTLQMIIIASCAVDKLAEVV